jgi:hypothetical protein
MTGLAPRCARWPPFTAITPITTANGSDDDGQKQ